MSTIQEEFVAPMDGVRSFAMECMERVGTCREHSAQLADLLLDADLVGHYSHGMNRLWVYVEDVANGVKGEGVPTVLKQKGATAWVDGQQLLGVVVGNFCTDLAIGLAKEHGIGWVVANNSNHYGICQHYAKRMARAGMIGMSFTNTSPIVFPNRSAQLALGTNPICCCANSSRGGDGFLLDMATSTVAFGKVELAKVHGKKEIPQGWGADHLGRPTNDPEVVLAPGGGLLPLGGVEEGGAYKGTGLAMMVELFCGILGGGAFGKNMRMWEVQEPANLSQCFVAIDPECFAPEFAGRLQQFMDETRALEAIDPGKPVLVPGDPERSSREKSLKAGGIVYTQGQLLELEKLAQKCNLEMFSHRKLE